MKGIQLIGAIVDGTYDADLELLEGAINGRKRALGLGIHHPEPDHFPANNGGSGLTARDFKSGDRVVFNDRINPRYLLGVTATIKRPKNTRVVINLDRDAGRFRAGVDITCYPNTLDKIAK